MRYGRVAHTEVRREESRLLAEQVLRVFLILQADSLHDVFLRIEVVGSLYDPGFLQCAGVLHPQLKLQVSQIGAAIPLHQVQHFRVRMTIKIEPGLIVKANAVDHQRVFLPAPH